MYCIYFMPYASLTTHILTSYICVPFYKQFREKAQKCLIAKILCMFSSVASVSVALVEIFLWQWASLLQTKKRVTARRTEGHTGCLLGLVCVCCHSNCQAGMAEAWWRVLAATWSMDSKAGRAEQRFGNRAQKKKRTKEEASGGSAKTQPLRLPTIYQHGQG